MLHTFGLLLVITITDMNMGENILKMCAFLLATLYAKVRSLAGAECSRCAGACSTVQLSNNKTQNSDSALPGHN